jgi:bifunctional ADP-heptose synthase (sugar kinase/adenylyltransferase)
MSDTELVLVETVFQHRMRYIVEVPMGKKDRALDTVVCQEATEFSQHFSDETIISHRVVSKEEVLLLCDEDNEYTKDWTDKDKLETHVTWIKNECKD